MKQNHAVRIARKFVRLDSGVDPLRISGTLNPSSRPTLKVCRHTFVNGLKIGIDEPPSNENEISKWSKIFAAKPLLGPNPNYCQGSAP